MKRFLSSVGLSIVLSGSLFAIGQINIAYSPYTISQPGSYIVVKDLKTSQDLNCITITTSNVFIDLNGHTLYGAGTSTGSIGNGIFASGGCINVSVYNGSIRDFRQAGIDLSNGSNIQINHLLIFNNRSGGMFLGDNPLVQNNSVYSNGGIGISFGLNGIVIDNIIKGNGSGGIGTGNGAVIQRNDLRENAGVGINTGASAHITGNSVFICGSNGINATANSFIQDNGVNSNSGYGIVLSSSSNHLNGNNCTNNGLSGINASGNSNVIQNNTLFANGTGLNITGTGNYYAGNKSQSNTLNENVASGNTNGDAKDQSQIAIGYAPYSIITPGNYILVKDLQTLTNQTAISISTSNVTLDLNGHTLYGAGSTSGTTGMGVYTGGSNNHNITVFNGMVRDFRDDGIGLDGNNNIIYQIHSIGNGGYGISASGAGCIVSNNIASQNVSDGIYAGQGTIVRDNNVSYNNSYGIYASLGCDILRNNCLYNNGPGIFASDACNIKDNVLSHNIQGITVFEGCYVYGNNCYFNRGTNGYGINVINTNNVLENNLMTSNDTGLNIAASGNYFTANRFRMNSLDTSVASGNTEGNGVHGFSNLHIPDSQPNLMIQYFAGFDIPALKESPQGVLRNLYW